MGCSRAISAESPHLKTRDRTAVIRFALILCVFWVPLTLCAQEPSPKDLQKMARNPFADIIKVPFSPDIYFDAGPYHRTAADLQVQPFFPFRISQGWLFIPRIVATAINYVPDLTQASGGTVGTGDMVSTFFFTPAHVRRIIWGFGPALLIPTATNSQLGAGRWGLGPSFAVLSQPEWGSVGVLVQNILSPSASTKRGPVNQMQIQPMFSYNLPHEWYLTTNPTISGDWTQHAGDHWLVPIGGGPGRTFKVGRQPVDANLTLYRNVVRPVSQFSPKWQLTLQVTLLFAKHG